MTYGDFLFNVRLRLKHNGRKLLDWIWASVPDIPGRVTPPKPRLYVGEDWHSPVGIYRVFTAPEDAERRLPNTEDEYKIALLQWEQEDWRDAEPGLSKYHCRWL